MTRHPIFRRDAAKTPSARTAPIAAPRPEGPDTASGTGRETGPTVVPLQPARPLPPAARAPVRDGALFVLGMDNLDALEDLFGEAVGDEVADVVRERLEPFLPEGARLWRAEHRRFALAADGMTREAASELFTRLQAGVAMRAIETSQGPVAVTVAAGAAFGSGDTAAMMADARFALADAMGRGVGCIRFAEKHGEINAHRAEVAAAARTAIGALGSGNLVIAFQPVVSAGSTGRAAFHECLVRVRDPDGEPIAAAKFMPAIEQLGLAPLIDRQVLVLALEALARNPGIRLSINIFPQTMQDAQWMMLFSEGLRQDDTLAERLIIEVTETAAMLDPARTQDFMDRLRRAGCAFALDDFGMGHTSFGSLRDFRFDMIKIDGSFIRDVTTSPDNRFFVSKLVEIGAQFEMATVAEFVQGPADARILRDLGVEYFQGFYFGKPCLMLDPAVRPESLVAGAE